MTTFLFALVIVLALVALVLAFMNAGLRHDRRRISAELSRLHKAAGSLSRAQSAQSKE